MNADEKVTMFKGLGNFASMMGGLQKLPARLQQLNDQLRDESILATAGEGAVEVELNGIGEMKAIRLDAEGVEIERLQVWIVVAYNEAHVQAKQLYADHMRRTAEELNLNVPGLDGALSQLTGGGG